MYGDASEITVRQQLDLTRVQSASHIHAEDAYAEGNLASGTECVAREVESDQMTVSGLLDDTPAMKVNTLGNECVHISHDTRPTGIASRNAPVGGLGFRTV